MRGTVKVAVLKNNNTCSDIVAALVYDTKFVHLPSMVCSNIGWKTKSRKVFDKAQSIKVQMKFKRLNQINMYNNRMREVDIANQLRLQYQPDHWVPNKDGWMVIFMLGLVGTCTKTYMMYCRILKYRNSRS